MSDDDLMEYMRDMLMRWMHDGSEKGWFVEETYVWVVAKLMEAKTLDEMQWVIPRMAFAAEERKIVSLLERMKAGREKIASEPDPDRKAKMEQHYKKLENELREARDKCEVKMS